MFKLADGNILPNEFTYPKSFNKLIELNLTNFEVWYFMDSTSVESRIIGLRDRYPTRSLIPFARRGDCDDIACFEVGHNGKIFIIHDYASEGYEQREVFESIWDWVQYVVNIMIEFEKMEDLQ